MKMRSMFRWIDGYHLFPQVDLLPWARHMSRVNSLIGTDNGAWDINFLKPFVVEEKFNAIVETHTCDQNLKDKLVWPFEKKRDLFGQVWISLGFD